MIKNRTLPILGLIRTTSTVEKMTEIDMKPSPAISYRPKIRRNALYSTMVQTYRQMIQTYEDCEDQSTTTFGINAVATFTIALRHEAALNKMLRIAGMMKRDKTIYRHEMKKALNEATKLAYEYDNIIDVSFQYRDDLYINLSKLTESFRSYIEEDITYLRNCIYDDAKKLKIKHLELFADVEVVCFLLRIYEYSQELMERKNLLLRGRLMNLRYLSIKKHKAAWEKVMALNDKICGYHGEKFVSELCVCAMRRMESKMNDYKFVKKLISTDEEESED